MGSPRLQSVKTTRLRSERQKMFVKSPLGRTFCLEDIRTARDAINVVCEKENLPTDSPSQWRAEQCGKLVTSLDSPLHHTGTLYILPSNPLPGGKGGFGSLVFYLHLIFCLHLLFVYIWYFGFIWYFVYI